MIDINSDVSDWNLMYASIVVSAYVRVDCRIKDSRKILTQTNKTFQYEIKPMAVPAASESGGGAAEKGFLAKMKKTKRRMVGGLELLNIYV